MALEREAGRKRLDFRSCWRLSAHSPACKPCMRSSWPHDSRKTAPRMPSI